MRIYFVVGSQLVPHLQAEDLQILVRAERLGLAHVPAVEAFDGGLFEREFAALVGRMLEKGAPTSGASAGHEESWPVRMLKRCANPGSHFPQPSLAQPLKSNPAVPVPSL